MVVIQPLTRIISPIDSKSMEVAFRDAALLQLYVDPQAQAPFPAPVVKRFRKVVWLIRNAVDERDFRAFGKGLGFEKLKGDRSHQHAFRLNDQFRLIVELCGEAPRKTVEVIEIVDYH
jgi:toxin HigB-1